MVNFNNTDNYRRNKEPWLSVCLSWIIPGTGQIYTRNHVRGIVFVVFAGLFYIFRNASLMWEKCSPYVSLAIGLFSFAILSVFVCVDAFILARRYNTLEFEKERAANKDPWLAVFLSIVLPGLGHAYIRRWVLSVVYFLGFIAIAILLKHTLLPEHTFLAPMGILLLRVFVSINAYISSPIRREQKLNSIFIFAIFIMSIGCLSNILIPWFTTTYMGFAISVTWGPSMEPTIRTNDRLFVNKLIYAWSDPKVGDVVVLKIPKGLKIPSGAPQNIRYTICKRVVAIGGEAVLVKDGKIYVNGKERQFGISENLNESFNYNKFKKHYAVFGVDEPYYVPTDCYFVLGDNIKNSADSRFFGAVTKDVIIGKATKIYWPPLRMGLLH